MNKKAIEEAGQKYLSKVADGKRTTGYADEDFRMGALWQQKRSYTEEESVSEKMYYVRNEGFLGNALLWWTKGCNGYTCDINNAHKFTREEAESTCKRPQDSAYRCDYIDKLEKAKKLIIDCQYVDNSERLWK
jgi:hypothetical protein